MHKVLGFQGFGIQLVLWLIWAPVWAQSDLRKAQEHFQSYEFAQAIAAYQQVLKSRPATLALAQHLAHAYRLNNNSQEAEAWFSRVLAFPDHAPTSRYHYAEALTRNGKYAEAKAQYQAYAASVPAEAALVTRKVAAIDLALSWLRQPAPVALQPVAALNSTYADFGPVFFDQGLLFASDRPAANAAGPLAGWTGRPYIQLFYARRDSSQAWSEPAPLEPAINTASHNGPAATQGTQVIYFTRTFIRKDTPKGANTDPTSWTSASDQGNAMVNRLAIYSAEKRKGKWINIRPFAYNKVAQYSVGHPALSPDGKYLYFVSDMPGGQGQTDIYYCERRTGGSWSRPVNAGPAINTSGRESFPMVAPDSTLYFASDGHPGMGGLDLFAAAGTKANWKQVRNLMPPFNSPKDDFGILWEADGLRGYLSSNRASADGTDDIYAFQAAGRTAAAALPDARPAATPVTKPTALLPAASRSGDTLVTARKQPPQGQSPLPLALQDIYFDLDKWDIRLDAAAKLNKLVTFLQQNPRLRIQISAHTDSRHTRAYNLELSRKRAQAVLNYLVSKGISANRLQAEGYGENRLLQPCPDNSACSEAQHQLNRRTNFRTLP